MIFFFNTNYIFHSLCGILPSRINPLLQRLSNNAFPAQKDPLCLVVCFLPPPQKGSLRSSELLGVVMVYTFGLLT